MNYIYIEIYKTLKKAANENCFFIWLFDLYYSGRSRLSGNFLEKFIETVEVID